MADRSCRHGRWLRVVAAVLVALAGIAVVAVGLTRSRLDTRASSFLPAADPAYEAWVDVQQSFGADPIVVVLESEEPGGLIGAHLPTVLALEGRLARLDDVSVVYGPGTLLNQLAIRAQELLAEISGRRDGIRAEARQEALAAGASPEEAEVAAEKASSAFDARYGTLLLGGMDAGLPTLRNPRFAESVVHDEAGRIRPDWQWLLPDETHAAVLVRPEEILEQEALVDLVERVTDMVDDTTTSVDGLSAMVTGAPVVTTALGDQVITELPRLTVVALLLVAAAFALTHRVPWSRRLLPLAVSLGATAVTVAAFGWLNIPLSVGVLGFLPILLGVGSDFPIYAASHGRSRAVLTAAVASAVGFATLALSPLPFVRRLGLALAIGVLVSAVLGLVVVRWLAPTTDGPVHGEARATSGSRTTPPPGRAVAAVVTVAAVALGGVGWATLASLEVEARPHELAAGLPAVDRAMQAEQVLGASGEIAVVVDGPEVVSAETLGWFRQVDAQVAQRLGDQLRPLVSPGQLLRFLGDDPTASQVAAGLDVLPSYLTSAVVHPDGRQALLLYGLELTDLRRQAELVEQLRASLPPAPEGLELQVVGLPVVAARSVSILDQSRLTSNLAGLVGAAAVLLVGVRRRWWAGVALLASATAFGWLIAGLWALGLPLSPLTIALGSLTAAVGGEFTVVALEHRRHVRRGGIGPVGAAAVTSAAGFVALWTSELQVLRTFGVTLAASVLLAWAAARLAVWALPAFAHRPTVDGVEPTTAAISSFPGPVGSRAP